MIKVRNIMTKEVIPVSKSLSLIEAAKLMTYKSVSDLVVVEKGMPVATISENDIIKGIVSKKTTVKDAMSREFMIISPLKRFSEIIKSQKERKIKTFMVVENEKLSGIITETDIIEAVRDFTKTHQIVQEVILSIFGLATAFFLFI